MNDPDRSESEAILLTCLLASFCDGDKSDAERQRIREIAASLDGGGLDIPGLYRQALIENPALETIAGRLPAIGARQLAYEMAVCVCDADDVRSESEIAFLARLREAFGLGVAAREVEAASTALSSLPAAPVTEPPALETADPNETGAMILRYAVVAGALELLPQTLASLAIIPLQTKMVYRIGKQRGHDLDRKSIGEFTAAIGLGMASQVFEGFARRLMRQLGKKAGGKKGGKIGDAAGGIAMSFASTYALGKLAEIYYDSGRTLSMDLLRSKFAPLVEEGKTLALRYAPQIAERSQQLRGADFTTVLKGAI